MTGAGQKRTSARYAAAHPLEDWAETFAHYPHMRDTLQTAAAWEITVAGSMSSAPAASNFPALVTTWMTFTLAPNAVNRSMGQDDLYPFVLPDRVIDKLGFIHAVVTQRSGTSNKRLTLCPPANARCRHRRECSE